MARCRCTAARWSNWRAVGIDREFGAPRRVGGVNGEGPQGPEPPRQLRHPRRRLRRRIPAPPGRRGPRTRRRCTRRHRRHGQSRSGARPIRRIRESRVPDRGIHRLATRRRSAPSSTASPSTTSTICPAWSERNLSVGIIATPAWAAQRVADLMVEAGIRSILNFAPTIISVPADIPLRKVDLATELQILSYYRRGSDERAAEGTVVPSGGRSVATGSLVFPAVASRWAGGGASYTAACLAGRPCGRRRVWAVGCRRLCCPLRGPFSRHGGSLVFPAVASRWAGGGASYTAACLAGRPFAVGGGCGQWAVAAAATPAACDGPRRRPGVTERVG